MIVNRYTVGEMPNIVIPLGVQGENEARQIQLDFSAWMTEGVTGYPELKVLTPGGILYWASACRGDEAGIEDGENIYCWTLHNVDTGESGNGLIRIILFGENGERLKSQAARTYLAPEFDEAIEPPVSEEIWEAWMDEMGERSSATKDNAYKASLDAAAAEAYATAIKENRLDLIEGLMNIATTQEITIATTDWVGTEGGWWEYTVSNPLVTEDTAAILNLDDVNAIKCQACIGMETGYGTIKFETDTKPTGDISGTLFLQGRFADAGVSSLSVRTTVTLDKNAWDDNFQTVSVEGMTATATVVVAPATSSVDDYAHAGIRCMTQGDGTLEFAAVVTPSTNINVNILGF